MQFRNHAHGVRSALIHSESAKVGCEESDDQGLELRRLRWRDSQASFSTHFSILGQTDMASTTVLRGPGPMHVLRIHVLQSAS
jgi:hypothetical protein